MHITFNISLKLKMLLLNKRTGYRIYLCNINNYQQNIDDYNIYQQNHFSSTGINQNEWHKELLESCKRFSSDIREGYRMFIKRIQGYELTRSELRKLKLFKGNMLKVLPFGIFCIVPGIVILLPLYAVVYFK